MKATSDSGIGPRDVVFCAAMRMQTPLAEKVEAAARAGYRGISLTVLDHGRARAEGMGEAEIRSLIVGHGLVPREYEALTQWLVEYTAGPAGRGSQEAEERNALAAAEAVGCPDVTAVHLGEGEVSIAAAAEIFAALCDRAAQRGLGVCLEFLPWTGIGDLRTARTVVETAGRPNGRLVIDSWHLHRSGTSLQELAQLPGQLVGCVQLSDAAVTAQGSQIDETMHARLLPGEGAIDLVGLIRTLDQIGSTAPLGLEVISDRLNALTTPAVAEAAMQSLRAVLERARDQDERA